jgi:hypothetical protein
MSAIRPTASQVAVLAVGALLVSGCGDKPAGGDPGGRRLKELENDHVFASPAPGARNSRTTRTPARYRDPGFSGGGWDGPSLVVSFTSSAPTADIYRFYAQQAEAAGWRATASGSLGLADRWQKTYEDGAKATLLLSLLTRSTNASERRYTLSGGVAPV